MSRNGNVTGDVDYTSIKLCCSVRRFRLVLVVGDEGHMPTLIGVAHAHTSRCQPLAEQGWPLDPSPSVSPGSGCAVILRLAAHEG